MAQKRGFNIFYLFALLWLAILVHDFTRTSQSFESIAYSQFLSALSQGQISEVAVTSDGIDGTYKVPTKGHPKMFHTNRIDDPNLIQRLSTAGVKFSGVPEDTFWKTLASWIIPALIMVGLWSILLRRFGGTNSRGGFLSLGKNKAKIYLETNLKTRFEDVAGVDEAKCELREIVNFLREPVEYSKLGGRMPKGVLLVGPPGTGKTMLARAVAGEAQTPFFSINGSEFVELFVGLGAARVRDLFEQARAQAPCIIFIDELDALGKARGINAITGSGNDEKEQTLNQLLAEIDGFDPSRGVVLIGATNRPEVLDPALLRAGRFDRQILVDKPDRKGREKILEVHMKNIKKSQDSNPETIASMTVGFSGADLATLVNEAALIATRRHADSVEPQDFTEALERVVAGLEKRDRILRPEEKRRVAYHEMGHTVVALALGKDEIVHKVSIVPRSMGALGYTFRRPTEDRYLMSKRELQDKMAVALGGRAAEVLFFSDISTGAADDLDKATEIARAMITHYGMSEKIGLATLERKPSPLLGTSLSGQTHEFSESTAQEIDFETKRLLSESFRKAILVLSENRNFINKCAEILLKQETLDESELKHLWNQRLRRVA